MKAHWLIVGAGFAGAVLAERLASIAGHRVVICDRRPHIGGNAYDYRDADGLLVHKYGPHIFHTNSDEVFRYLSRFTGWRPYEHRVLAEVDGKRVPIPINLDTVNKLYDLELESHELEAYFQKVAERVPFVRTSEDAVVSRVGRDLYEKFFRGYTRKQWGLDPSELDATVTARIPTRTNRDDRYFTDKHQVMPREGYTAMFQRLLAHPNITVLTGADYRDLADVQWERMIYTGPIDAFYGHRYGALPYRSLEFRHRTERVDRFQEVGTVNFPNDHDYTRVTEFKHLTGDTHPGRTSLVYEYPRAEGDPYYPVPRPQNTELYHRYAALAEAEDRVHFVGRLATYRYYNMDQVVAQALTVFRHLVPEVGTLRGAAEAVA
jgi:UDP-galactopyranose mutase